MGRYIQEFKKGEVIESGGRTITEADLVMFTGFSWDTNPAHNDEVWCRTQSPMGQRIAHGALIFSIMTGLSARGGFMDGTAIAFLGFKDWKFLKPVCIGDTIHLRATIVDNRVSKSKPDRGVLQRRVEVVNQRGEVVQSGLMKTMLKAKPERPAEAR